MARSKDGLLYLKMYPELRRKWINQCVCCQHVGHKPELPEEIYPGGAAQNLRRYFRPLALDARGLCEQCAGEDSVCMV
jgi:hypothetical protein